MSFLAKADELIAGRYRLRRPIGEGGMGGVWEATDQVLGCPIALKLVPEKHLMGDREQQIQRFLREARLAAQVQHPSVVRVTDFGVHEDTPYIAMELLAGESLAERMYRLPLLEIEEAVQLCIGILRGLGAAHEAGVVHRDIKPENVQLVSTVEGLYPKLIDFGISLGTDQNNKRVSAVTTNGHVFGTPLYMSPEHARGFDIDGRADLYSLGIILYEMVARKPPFTAENPADMMAAVVRDVPTAPREIRPTIPQALSDAIMRALSKEPDDRYADANEMTMALAAAVPAAKIDTTGPVALNSGVHRITAPTTSSHPTLTSKRRLGLAFFLTFSALCVGAWLTVDFQSEPLNPPERSVEQATPAETLRAPETVVESEVGENLPLEPLVAEMAMEGVAEAPEDPSVAPETPVTERRTRPRAAGEQMDPAPTQTPTQTNSMSFRELDY